MPRFLWAFDRQVGVDRLDHGCRHAVWKAFVWFSAFRASATSPTDIEHDLVVIPGIIKRRDIDLSPPVGEWPLFAHCRRRGVVRERPLSRQHCATTPIGFDPSVQAVGARTAAWSSAAGVGRAQFCGRHSWPPTLLLKAGLGRSLMKPNGNRLPSLTGAYDL